MVLPTEKGNQNSMVAFSNVSTVILVKIFLTDIKIEESGNFCIREKATNLNVILFKPKKTKQDTYIQFIMNTLKFYYLYPKF